MTRISSYICICVLALLYLGAIFADYIAPYSPLRQNPEAGYASPTKVYWNVHGVYIYRQHYKLNPQTLKKDSFEIKKEKYYLKFFTRGKLISVDNSNHKKNAYLYLLGTDQLGRDLLSRLIYGARPSLSIGFLGLLIAFPIAIIYGGISGFAGGIVDNIMMRIAEAIMSLPGLYLLIILSAILPASLSNTQRFLMITIILSFISWAGLSRIIRGQILTLKSKDFVLAAESIGKHPLATIMQNLIPHTASFLIVAATLAIPGYIVGESALSFLGLGINQPDPSWGNILAEGKELSNILTRPWLIWTPALLIFASVLSFNLVGDELRDKLDPHK